MRSAHVPQSNGVCCSPWRPAHTQARVALLTSTLCVSAVFVFVKQLHDVPPLLRASWRLQSTLLACAIPLLYLAARDPAAVARAASAYRNDVGVARALLQAAAGYAAYNILLSVALNLTSLVQVTVLSQCAPVVLLLQRWCTGVARVTRPQVLGCLLAIAGAGLTVYVPPPTGGAGAGPSSAMHEGGAEAPDHLAQVAGCVAALLAAAGYAVYLACGAHVRAAPMPLFLYVCPLCLVSGAGCVVLALALEPVTLDMHPATGVLGWLAPANALTVGGMAVVAGLLGMVGVSWSVGHLPALEVAVFANLEPLFAAVIAWATGDALPGAFALLGGAVATVGLTVLVAGEQPAPRGRDATHRH